VFRGKGNRVAGIAIPKIDRNIYIKDLGCLDYIFNDIK
jgi:hypothetical protein